MRIVKLKDVLKGNLRKELIESIRKGDVIIHPTDTIYGIGCNIDNEENVEKIYKAKQRSRDKPLSIIIPSKKWIDDNCVISKENRNFVDGLLPGPYTIILKLKPNVKIPTSKNNTVGVRIPKNEFIDMIRREGILFITTSVNISEEDHAKIISEIPDQIKQITDWIIDSGKLEGEPSRIFDLSKKELEIVRY